MNGFGALFIYGAALGLAAYTVARRDTTFANGIRRAIEQATIILPRLIFALLGAGFLVTLIPTEVIVRFLGEESGFTGIMIGSLTGLLVASGPALSFAIAAAFATEGASVPALVAFLTGWSVFAAHRVLIFEIPMFGLHWVRLRMLAVVPLPPIAGALAMLVTT
ncbi:MAG: hypothetical protein KJO82_13905 [Gammaproteobacteria bacterium]|nr:hypothetical protein [Gammaproteobacteria bacterium]